MSPDTKALVDAIDSLKHTDSFLKSYIYPLLPAIISTLAGYFIALFNFNRQQNKTSNDNKVKDVNKFLIEVQSAFISLIEEKKKYQFLISNDPQPQNRLVQIREINTVFPD
ncbi:hypothetical protein GV761_14590, partial [Citrobacter werkmanii]|uniref:hypothetical protein n=2 Tax=Enterobacteriaceae TaxID=543 RepID=UPI0013774A50